MLKCSQFPVLLFLFFASCSLLPILCFLFYVSYAMLSFLCFLFSASCSQLPVLCFLFSASCYLLSVLCFFFISIPFFFRNKHFTWIFNSSELSMNVFIKNMCYSAKRALHCNDHSLKNKNSISENIDFFIHNQNKLKLIF